MKDELILPSLDMLHKQSKRVAELSQPLQKLGITLFSHTKIYRDNSFIDISDRIDMLDYFYYQTNMHQYYTPDVDPWQFDSEFFLCSTMQDNPSISGLREQNMDNILVLINKYEDHCELFHFGGAQGDASITNFYLNNLELLKAFAVMFKNSAQPMIQEAEQDKFFRVDGGVTTAEPPAIITEPTSAKAQEPIFNDLCFKKFEFPYQGRTYSLSKRETEILAWSLLGKTSLEVGLILGLSKRTVENHLAKIKIKFDCYKLLDVIRILYQAGVAYLLIESYTQSQPD